MLNTFPQLPFEPRSGRSRAPYVAIRSPSSPPPCLKTEKVPGFAVCGFRICKHLSPNERWVFAYKKPVTVILYSFYENYGRASTKMFSKFVVYLSQNRNLMYDIIHPASVACHRRRARQNYYPAGACQSKKQGLALSLCVCVSSDATQRNVICKSRVHLPSKNEIRVF